MVGFFFFGAPVKYNATLVRCCDLFDHSDVGAYSSGFELKFCTVTMIDRKKEPFPPKVSVSISPR